ncbi:PREDICTED: arginase, hepatic-like [Priapulus caudatus]|uniref:Arginase n=1 Tax=Priapulus caudatus TaxID=37621 RepID=A0ABM1DXU0_PRICU|nr:PREDICTED: arginase, hepatic-like [Priapulus caudatus]
MWGSRSMCKFVETVSLRRPALLRQQRRFIRRDGIGVVGVPFAHGQNKPGVHEGPRLLREAGFIDGLEKLAGWKVHDYGDLDFELVKEDESYGPCNIQLPRTNGLANKLISAAVQKSIVDHGTCISIGGDHSLSAGTIHGHAQAHEDIVLIWVDAHADINTSLTSYTGHLHGMSGAFSIKELDKYIPKMPGWDWLTPTVAARDIVYIGLRDVDPGERYLLDKYRIQCYDMYLVEKYGMAKVMEMTLEYINPKLNRPIHLSFDIDCLDIAFAPATGTPVPGGLTLREGLFLAEELNKTEMLTGVDLVEVNPMLGTDVGKNLTLWAANLVLQSCFGKITAGNVPAGFEMPKPEDVGL